jgi:two-component system OmpR family response regulator
MRNMARVLLVEDEPRMASFVARALTAEGFSVECAQDGLRGLDLVRDNSFDLIILDLLMPGADGFEVLEGIVEHDPAQRVLVLSAMSGTETKVRCLEQGAADYLGKPFAVRELLARVRARIREPEAQPLARVLTAGPIRLDLIRRTADVGERRVVLSEREFALLERLMRARGEVCTRQVLLQDVWGVSFDPGSNVVDVTVRRLRAKLGPGTIDTVRNVGYRLEAA